MEMDTHFKTRRKLLAMFRKISDTMLAEYKVFKRDCKVISEAYYRTKFGDPFDQSLAMYQCILEVDHWTQESETRIGRMIKLVKLSRAWVDNGKLADLVKEAEGILEPDETSLDHSYIYRAMQDTVVDVDETMAEFYD